MSGAWGHGIPASALEPGDQFIFARSIGGEGEVVTVVAVTNSYGTLSIETEELDFSIDVTSTQSLSVREQG